VHGVSDKSVPVEVQCYDSELWFGVSIITVYVQEKGLGRWKIFKRVTCVIKLYFYLNTSDEAIEFILQKYMIVYLLCVCCHILSIRKFSNMGE
jgi:hypothetical protein